MNYEDIFRLNIEEVIAILVPKFGITPEQAATFQRPRIKICDAITIDGHPTGIKGIYYPMTLDLELTKSADARIIGHEVGHYLHHELNPAVVEEMLRESFQSGKFWREIY